MLTDFYLNNLLLILYLQFLFFLVLFILNFKYIKFEFKTVNKKVWIILLIIIIFAISTHLRTIDMYGNSKIRTLTMAKMFSLGETYFYTTLPGEISLPYPWGPTYPFLLSNFFLISDSPKNILFFDAIMIGMAISIIFLLSYFLFRNEYNSLIFAFILFLIFLLGYEIAFESEEIYFFFILLSLLFSFISFKLNKSSFYTLALLTILITMEIRFEAASLILVFFLGLVLYRFKEFRKVEFLSKLILPLFIFLIFFPIYFIKVSTGEKVMVARYVLQPLGSSFRDFKSLIPLGL